MERFFKILYYYCLGMLVFFVAYLSVALAISPKNDAQKRGFIPCTQDLVLEVSLCERGKITCPLGALWSDTKCNIHVVFDGLGAWIKARQPTPWANYLFEPLIEEQLDQEDPYQGNVADEMKSLEEQRQFIEMRQKELNEAKNREMNLDENVLISEPNAEPSLGDKIAALQKEVDEEAGKSAEHNDINDEADIDFATESVASSATENVKQKGEETNDK